jgi:hypothetical protein
MYYGQVMKKMPAKSLSELFRIAIKLRPLEPLSSAQSRRIAESSKVAAKLLKSGFVHPKIDCSRLRGQANLAACRSADRSTFASCRTWWNARSSAEAALAASRIVS